MKKQKTEIVNSTASENLAWIIENYPPSKRSVELCPECQQDVFGFIVENGEEITLSCDKCGYSPYYIM